VGVKVKDVELRIKAKAETRVIKASVELRVKIKSWIKVKARIKVIKVKA
jgi:hypothetical protein